MNVWTVIVDNEIVELYESYERAAKDWDFNQPGVYCVVHHVIGDNEEDE
jgi:hypothetical protein